MNIFSLKSDKWLRIVGTPLITFFIPFVTPLITPGSQDSFFAKLPLPNLYCILVGIVVFELNRWLLAQFRNWYPTLKDTMKRISLQISTQLIFTTIAAYGILFIWYKYILEAHSFKPFIISNIYVGISIAIIITLLYESFYFVEQWKLEFILRQKLSVENNNAQLHILKRQLDPHFMFNSLGTLSSLIEINPAAAVEFVGEFSDVYRYILSHAEETVISLDKEIVFVENYISLLKKRFGNNELIAHIDIPSSHLKRKIPTLTLQILVENIVKHNAINTEQPVKIEIYVEDGEKLVVKNNIQRKYRKEHSTQLGLDNIRRRYALIQDKTIEILKHDNFYVVKIPLID